MNKKVIQKSTNRKITTKDNTSYSNDSHLVKTELFGVSITSATTREVLEYLVSIIRKTRKNIYVVTPNPEILLLANKNISLKNALNNADLALCDGMQLYRAAHFLGKPLKERIIGTDLVEKLCERVEDWPITVGFLGGRPGVAEKVAECLLTRFPSLKVNFVAEEWPQNNFLNKEVVSSQKLVARKEKINRSLTTNYQLPSTIDILFVAFGAPKQELWMAEHVNKIPVRVMIGVGGAFDQIVNPSLRPPKFVHALGFGWMYRLVREPWRITRQAKLINFLRMVAKEKLRGSLL